MIPLHKMPVNAEIENETWVQTNTFSLPSFLLGFTFLKQAVQGPRTVPGTQEVYTCIYIMISEVSSSFPTCEPIEHFLHPFCFLLINSSYIKHCIISKHHLFLIRTLSSRRLVFSNFLRELRFVFHYNQLFSPFSCLNLLRLIFQTSGFLIMCLIIYFIIKFTRGESEQRFGCALLDTFTCFFDTELERPFFF